MGGVYATLVALAAQLRAAVFGAPTRHGINASDRFGGWLAWLSPTGVSVSIDDARKEYGRYGKARKQTPTKPLLTFEGQSPKRAGQDAPQKCTRFCLHFGAEWGDTFSVQHEGGGAGEASASVRLEIRGG